MGRRNEMVNRKKALKFVVTVLWITAVAMALLITGNQSLLSTLAVFITLVILSILAYRTNDVSFRKALFGIRRDNLLKSIIWGLGLTGVAFGVLKATGLSIGLPIVAQAIGDSIRNIVVLGFAPVVETVFFASVVYALIFSRTKSRAITLWGTSAIFALAHVAAYVQGFYNYPSFVSGFDALGANVGSFLAAFLFMASTLTVQRRLKNLAFSMVYHFGTNLVITITTFVIFAF